MPTLLQFFHALYLCLLGSLLIAFALGGVLHLLWPDHEADQAAVPQSPTDADALPAQARRNEPSNSPAPSGPTAPGTFCGGQAQLTSSATTASTPRSSATVPAAADHV